MARTNAQKKGDILEDAVRMIETVILQSNPNTKEATLTIEAKKRVTVQGVRHEIDIYISVDLGNGYELTYIFECKNREESVSKDDITVFSDKINEVSAQKGYFIAKTFGRDAINRAKRDKRIVLLKATEELNNLPFLIESFHFIFNIPKHINLYFVLKTDDPQKVGVGNLTFTDESSVRLGNEELSLAVLRGRVQQIVMNEEMSHEPTETFSAGAYPYDRTKKFSFGRNEVFVDGNECTEFNAQVFWETHVIHRRAVSKFDIEKRGRVITIESDDLPTGGNIQISFIELE